MAAGTRYLGINCVIMWNASVISNDFTDLSLDFTVKTDERTAGNDQFQSFNASTRGGKFSLKILDPGPPFASVLSTLRPGATGTISVYSQGQASGKPIESFPALISDVKKSIKPDKNVEIDIDGMINGQPISDIGTLQ